MEQYIRQLIEDLLAVAKNPPKPHWIEPPPHLEEDAVFAELALVPFQTIEELTGIKQEVFPEMDDLQGDQWERVNEAIFKLFESLQIEHWKECYVFHPLEEDERLEIINEYFEWIEDENFKEELSYILKSKNPIANFNAFIKNSNQNDDWFIFNMDCIKDRVRYTIYKELNQNHETIDDSELPF